jgi:DNA-directed RNA polymerase specialized sigma24 family protein
MNAALMRLRVSRRKRETSLDEVTETGEARASFHLVETRLNPEREYLSKEGRVLLEKGLKKLRPLYVEVLHLRNVQELSAKETARSLELPVGTVKARLHRARTKCATCAVDRYTQSGLAEVSGTNVAERLCRERHLTRNADVSMPLLGNVYVGPVIG